MQAQEKNFKFTEGHFWHFVLSSLYFILIVITGYILYSRNLLNNTIPVFDVILLGLAGFRLTRLIVKDKIFDFVRDYFNTFNSGLGNSIKELINCLWCIGVWISLFLVFIYFVIPYSWYLILILALSGVFSLIQIITNLIMKLNQ